MLLCSKKTKKSLEIIACLALVLAGCGENPYRSKFDRPSAIRSFVESGGDPNTMFYFESNPKNEYRFLHLAVEKNDADFARFLLKAGADPNLLNYAGETPLMRVFTQPHDIHELKLRNELIRVLAPVTDLYIQDDDGRTVVEFVTEIWGEEWMERLISLSHAEPI